MSEIVLDRKTFGALAEETRVKILKSLAERPKMQSELAKEQKLAVSTIAEHLEKLEAANLVRAKRGEHKWVYFSLTPKGEKIVSPEKHTGVFVFALSVSLLMIAGALFVILPQQHFVEAGISDVTKGGQQDNEGLPQAPSYSDSVGNKTPSDTTAGSNMPSGTTSAAHNGTGNASEIDENGPNQIANIPDLLPIKNITIGARKENGKIVISMSSWASYAMCGGRINITEHNTSLHSFEITVYGIPYSSGGDCAAILPAGATITLGNLTQGMYSIDFVDQSNPDHYYNATDKYYLTVKENETFLTMLAKDSLFPFTKLSGTLSVSSDPINANVFFDSKYKGTTPLSIELLSAQTYVINISKYGYLNYVNWITIEREGITYLNVTLVPLNST